MPALAVQSDKNLLQRFSRICKAFRQYKLLPLKAFLKIEDISSEKLGGIP